MDFPLANGTKVKLLRNIGEIEPCGARNVDAYEGATGIIEYANPDMISYEVAFRNRGTFRVRVSECVAVEDGCCSVCRRTSRLVVCDTCRGVISVEAVSTERKRIARAVKRKMKSYVDATDDGANFLEDLKGLLETVEGK